jgi:hypothetical protein
LPKTVEEAVAMAERGGLPAAFLQKVFLEHEGTAWKFAGKDITDWVPYVTSRWLSAVDANKVRTPAPALAAAPVPKPRPKDEPPVWLGDLNELVKVLAVEPRDDDAVIRLAENIPTSGLMMLEMDDRNVVLKLTRKKAAADVGNAHT